MNIKHISHKNHSIIGFPFLPHPNLLANSTPSPAPGMTSVAFWSGVPVPGLWSGRAGRDLRATQPRHAFHRYWDECPQKDVQLTWAPILPFSEVPPCYLVAWLNRNSSLLTARPVSSPLPTFEHSKTLWPPAPGWVFTLRPLGLLIRVNWNIYGRAGFWSHSRPIELNHKFSRKP